MLPTITGITPASGSTAGGTVVTLTGANLSGATRVVFGATAGTSLTVVSATQVRATSPAHAAGSVDLRVTTAGRAPSSPPSGQYTVLINPALASTGSGTLKVAVCTSAANC